MKNLRAKNTPKSRKKVRTKSIIAAKKRLIGARVWVITSSIACGKSTALKMLKNSSNSGAKKCASADEISARVLRQKWREAARKVLGAKALGRTRTRLGAADFSALKRALRAAIFDAANGGDFGVRKRAFNRGDFGVASAQQRAANKRKLEKLLHFRIKKRLLKAVAQGAELIEIPLYFESKNYKHFINKLVIFADESTQIKRLCARDGCSKTAARALLSAQISAAKKANWANFVIENNGDLAALAAACERFLKEKF